MKIYYNREPGLSAWDWGPVDPEEDAADHNDSKNPPDLDLPGSIENNTMRGQGPLADLATSLNKELTDKLKDNPNKLLGCGG